VSTGRPYAVHWPDRPSAPILSRLMIVMGLVVAAPRGRVEVRR
jgi:hypothetical protein